MKPSTSTSLRTRPVAQQQELLSFTNAAVQALTDDKQVKSVRLPSKDILDNRQNGSSSELSLTTSTNSLSDRRDVLKLGTDSNSSSSSSGCRDVDGMDLSSLESSFNTSTAVRVRVPSSVLREIKAPVNRSVDGSDASVTEPQPTPKIVRHVNGPSAWVSMSTSSPLRIPEHSISTHGEPTSTTTVYTHEITQANDVDKAWKDSEKSKSHVQSKGVVDEQIHEDKQREQVKPLSDWRKSHDGIGLSQGDRVTGILMGNTGRSDSVKAKSFSLSQRERLLKEEFTKRQDRKSAPIKRSVQPTIITSKHQKPDKEEPKVYEAPLENQVANAAAIAAAAASAATAPFFQVDARLRKLEELQQQLLSAQGSQMNSRLVNPSSVSDPVDLQYGPSGITSTVNTKQSYPQVFTSDYPSYPQATASQLSAAIPQAAQPSFMHQAAQPSFMHQLVQDHPFASLPPQSLHSLPQRSINDQDLNQPRHYLQTGIQLQQPLMDNVSQQAFMHKPAAPFNGYSSSSSKVQPSKSQEIVDTHPAATKTETVYTQTVPRSYVPAKQLIQHESSVITKPFKNTKTQTTPQDSSLSSSDSPLQTPLPRKKPPRPTPHSSSKGLKYIDLPTRKKRVHFDYVDKNDPVLSYSKYEPIDYSEQTRYQRAGPTHHVTAAPPTAPLRPAIQSREKVPATSETDIEQVMDELSRMRSDIRTVLTETEKVKSGLNHQKISYELDQKFSHDDCGPSLLDAYLTKKDAKQPIDPVKSFRITTPVVDQCADVKQILRDVEIQRSNLEHNLDAIVRQNEAESLYATVDGLMQGAQCTEVSHVRQKIDKMIKEMTTVIKKEIDNEGQKSKAKSETPINTESTNPKSKVKFQPGRKLPGKPYTFTGRQTRAGSGKENVPYNSKDKKNKPAPKTSSKPDSKPVSKPVSKPIPKPVSSSTNQTYLKSIYGRQPHHTHRTTSKAPYLHYQSPVNPRTAALTAAILGTGSRHPIQPSGPEPIREKTEKTNREAWYYFHPSIDKSQVIPSGDGRVHVHAPLEGRKMPMAIPLGKPRTDPSLRLPLPTDIPLIEPAKQEDSPAPPPQSTPIQPSPKPSPTKPNVAVITIQHEGLEEESLKKKRKTGRLSKKQPELAVQVLPQMDVDSLTESSEGTSLYESHILDKSKPVTRPADIEYEDFRNYLAVKDTEPEEEDQDDDDTPRIPTPENPLTIQGHTEKDRLYHGPPFPPEHPPLPAGNAASCVLDADQRVSDALEDRALDWVEQELLARIVSEMNQPLPDPTLATQPLYSPESSVVSDDGEVLTATIGLGGIQLFVDAGIPVDRDLVAELIRDVVAEQIASTLGYPKPTATPKAPQVDIQVSPQTPEQAATPVTTPVPTPVYTPVESESSAAHSPTVSTPDRTPTPSESSVTIETEEEPTPIKEVKEEEKEESEPEVSVARSPIPTPVATPTGSHSPTASVSTPEPSQREPDITDVGLPVDTPEPSVSLQSPKSITASTPTTVESPETPPPPPKPPSPVKSSPPSMTTSTLSPSTTSTLTTIDEELSEGQLIQPYVHGGKYSEGEYAMSPGLVDLVKERNIPTDTVDMMGKDEDSRNELIRIALHGLLRRGLYSTSSLNTTSTISTLRDADDIRQDSLDEYSHSEGEVVFPRDPVPVRYATRPVPAGASPHSRAKASPGELTPTALRTNRQSSPGETNTSLGARRTHPNTPHGRVIAVTPGSPKQQRQPTPNTSRDNSDSRSLHKSDLQHGHWRQPAVSSREGSPQRSPRNERYQSPNNSISDRPPSRDSNRQPVGGSDRQRSNGSDRQQPVFRPPIHVPIPVMEPDDSSGQLPGYDLGDTSGDVSSISGGDF